ncbi:MAG: serine hydrolase, partial [Pseudomonadota bacterium]
MFRKGLLGVATGLLLGSATAQNIELPSVALGDASVSDIDLPLVERIVWPEDEWDTASVPGSAEAEVTRLMDWAMDRNLDDEMGETRGLVIIHEGRLVAEVYRDGFDAETKQVSWSMAKSITQALVGRALQEGLIDSIDTPMLGPWDAEDPRASITWRQWLTMTDGLDYNEIGEADLAKNDVVQMMFGSGRQDVVGYVADLPLAHEPGTVWNYSTAGYHMISQALQGLLIRIELEAFESDETLDGFLNTAASTTKSYPDDISRKLGDKADALLESLVDIPKGQRAAHLRAGLTQLILQQVIFTPLGMDAVAEFDAAGTFLGGSLVYASPRDFARFGYLYLRDGVWKGERLLPENWVEFATTETPAENANVYGAGWWITPPEDVERSHGQAALTCPCDAFHAGGNEGQTIWVVPSKD